MARSFACSEHGAGTRPEYGRRDRFAAAIAAEQLEPGEKLRTSVDDRHAELARDSEHRYVLAEKLHCERPHAATARIRDRPLREGACQSLASIRRKDGDAELGNVVREGRVHDSRQRSSAFIADWRRANDEHSVSLEID